MIRIEICGTSARCIQPMLLTTGMVGASVEFSFDERWNGLQRCAVFTDGTVTKDVLVRGGTCVIPHEVLSTGGRILCVGVYGANGEGDIVIPTVYVQVGVIYAGAQPSGDESYPPSPDVTAQLQERLEALEQGGVGIGGGNGGYYKPAVTQVDENTVELSFTPSQTGMPAVTAKRIVLPAGADGADGTVSFAELTDEQRTSLKGERGEPGEKGEKGEKGEAGAPGADGKNGTDGKTPVRGVDYWTVADKQAVINEVLAAFPAAEGAGF